MMPTRTRTKWHRRCAQPFHEFRRGDGWAFERPRNTHELVGNLAGHSRHHAHKGQSAVVAGFPTHLIATEPRPLWARKSRRAKITEDATPFPMALGLHENRPSPSSHGTVIWYSRASTLARHLLTPWYRSCRQKTGGIPFVSASPYRFLDDDQCLWPNRVWRHPPRFCRQAMQRGRTGRGTSR